MLPVASSSRSLSITEKLMTEVSSASGCPVISSASMGSLLTPATGCCANQRESMACKPIKV